MMQRLYKIAALSLSFYFAFLPYAYAAAYAGIDNFESYSVGDLNGNNGGSGFSAAWSGDTKLDVQTSTTRNAGSTKAVWQDSATIGADAYVTRTLTSAADSGDIYLSIRKSTLQSVLDLQMLSGGTLGFYLRFDNGGNITLNGTASQTLVGGSANTWYDINITWVTASTVKARYKLSTDTTWSAYTSTVTLANSLTSVNTVKIGTQAAGSPAASCYWDDIQITDFAGASLIDSSYFFWFE